MNYSLGNHTIGTTRAARMRAWPMLAVAAWLSVGCSSSTNPKTVMAAAFDTNLKRATGLYAAYAGTHGLKGPSDEAALKAFVREGMTPKKLEMIGVDPANADAVFVSERDGKPFTIRYGMSIPMGSKVAVVFETVGVEGKRQVGFTGGAVEEVDSARYDALMKDSGTTGEPSGSPGETG